MRTEICEESQVEKYIKNKPVTVCCILFAVCMCVRFIEYFALRTDETVIGENFIHKAVGIVLLFSVLKAANMKWSDIGFIKRSFTKNILLGLLLSAVCFAVSYGAELILLSAQGKAAHIELYISGFSLTGAVVKNTGILFFLLCIIFNIINVWMEEGLFRGFFIKALSDKYSFMKVNLAAALLFGVWHFVMPVRSFIGGEMGFGQMLMLAAGYIVISGLMSIKWGLLYRMTGSLWLGTADHFFNNTVASNMLHVVTDSGADEMQIVRIMLAQIVSFVFVAAVYSRYKRKAY